MDIKELLSETEARYAERYAQREQQVKKIEAGTMLQADTPERVEKRLRRLARATAEVRVAGGEDIALERVLGTNDLIGIGYLEAGLRVAGRVGRVVIRTAAGGLAGYGTGSMVGPRLLLTNNHVLRSAQAAAVSLIEFNFQDLPGGGRSTPIVFALDPDAFFLTSVPLDYTLVAVREQALTGESLRTQGWSPLIEEEGKVLIGEALNIIQHPNGEPKQVALRENRLIDLLENHLHYHTDTAPGSSGSPVYNDQWEVVGLHHSGVPRRDAASNVLAKDGVIWQPWMGEQRIDWIANEGVRISRIVRDIKARPLDGLARQLRDEMFATPPLTPRPVETGRAAVPANRSAGGTGPEMGADGSATWTIPLRISINLGGAAAPPSPGISGSPVTVIREPGAAVGPDDADLRAALSALRASENLPYYDEAADARARDAYYADLPGTLSPVERYRRLRDLLRETHKTELGYKPALHLYPLVDLHPDRRLRSIYSGQGFDPEEFIREDLRIEQERAVQLRELMLRESFIGAARLAEALSLLEDAAPFNCEHVVPQSWFAKRQPMKGDLHHLFACESGCNNFRGNTPYFDFPDFEEAVRTDCGKREQNKFEPGAGKGAVARATLYFLLRYPREINNSPAELTADRLPILLRWHNENPVDEYERHRNAEIQKKQGNRNPLTDFPDWAAQIDFRRGLG